MLEFAPIRVGEGLPLSCTLCSSPAPATYTSADAFAATLAKVPPSAPGVALVGPEPFSHPELPKLIGACREAGFARIALESDGGALSVMSNATGALHAGVRHLWIRVLGADAESHDGLARRPGLWAAMRAGLGAYRAAADGSGLAVAVTAILPVCRHTLPSLSATVASCARLGFDAVMLKTTTALPESVAPSVAAACDTGMLGRVWTFTDGGLPLPESHQLHAAPDGYAAPDGTVRVGYGQAPGRSGRGADHE